ncbi:MAG: hypothetical protein EOO24_28605, partial [Comamonadaceae bacterium]
MPRHVFTHRLAALLLASLAGAAQAQFGINLDSGSVSIGGSHGAVHLGNQGASASVHGSGGSMSMNSNGSASVSGRGGSLSMNGSNGSATIRDGHGAISTGARAGTGYPSSTRRRDEVYVAPDAPSSDW